MLASGFGAMPTEAFGNVDLQQKTEMDYNRFATTRSAGDCPQMYL